MNPENQEQISSRADVYWKSTTRLTFSLLLLWFGTTFATIYFARSLSSYTLFGWPVSFFMAAQGSILIDVAIVAFYAWRMRHLDRLYGSHGEHDDS